MSEPMTAAELLPCLEHDWCTPLGHSYDCPAKYRPAVEQTISEAATAARVAEREALAGDVLHAWQVLAQCHASINGKHAGHANEPENTLEVCQGAIDRMRAAYHQIAAAIAGREDADAE